MKLTFAERWILSNQFKILGHLEPGNSKEHEKSAYIVERGFEGAYSRFSQHIDAEVVSEKVCDEVEKILLMFQGLQRSFSTLTDKSGIDGEKIRFSGFDQHSEGGHLAYAGFLNRDGWCDSVKVFDSHMPYLGMYRRMLSVWQQMEERQVLTKEEIQKLLSA